MNDAMYQNIVRQTLAGGRDLDEEERLNKLGEKTMNCFEQQDRRFEQQEARIVTLERGLAALMELVRIGRASQ